MATPPISPDQIDAVVFDVIGTLVDEQPAWAELSPRIAAEAGISDHEALRGRWAALLEQKMSAVVHGEAAWRSHRELVGSSAQEAITVAGGTPTSVAVTLAASLDDAYRAWPDTAPATAALRGSRLVAGASNGDLDALARLASSNKISWDIALSTAAVRTFKPAPAAYRYAIDSLGLDPARTLFVAAHPWDLRAASEHGFRTAYVARPGAEAPSEDDRFDLAVDDLLELIRFLAG